MSSIHHHSLTDDGIAALGLGALSDEVSGPILAGLRAHALVTRCERLDLAPILLDDKGRVLHVSPRAAGLMTGEMSVVADHLLGTDDRANRRIERLLADALAGGAADQCSSACIASRSGRAPLRLSAVRTRHAAAHQLLTIVVLVTRGVVVGRRALRQVRSALAAA